MHVVVAGCGRVGAQVATALEADHDVVVVDRDPRAFRRLGEGFSGTVLAGVAFDRSTLEAAGIRRADAFVAVTSGDNSNIVAARTAQERYGVERVVARIYDPLRAEIFERMGVAIVAAARWTAESVLRALQPPDARIEGSIGPGSGDVVLYTLTVPHGVDAVPASTLDRPGTFVLAAITRGGATAVPPADALLQSGDRVHLAAERTAVDVVRQTVELLGTED